MKTNDKAKVFVQAPCGALRLFVKRFLVVESSVAHGDSHLPDTGLVAAFQVQGDCILKDGANAPGSALTGLWDTLRTHHPSRDNMVALAAFTAAGAAAFVRQPLDEFRNATVAMEGVLGRPSELNRIHEQLAEAGHHAARVQIVERFLLAHIGRARPDPLVSAAVSWIEKAEPMVRIEDLVRHIGLSQSETYSAVSHVSWTFGGAAICCGTVGGFVRYSRRPLSPAGDREHRPDEGKDPRGVLGGFEERKTDRGGRADARLNGHMECGAPRRFGSAPGLQIKAAGTVALQDQKSSITRIRSVLKL
jgi:hypothetical protein